MSSPIKIMRVRIPAAGCADAPVEWLTLSTSGQVLERGRSTLAALRLVADIELVIPASLVALHALELPAVAARHEAAIIRQQLEDRVLGGLADSHYVRGERQSNQQAVWLISHRWMLALLAACRAAGIFPVRAVPEQALLPAQSYAASDDGFVYRSSSNACGILPDEALLAAVCDESLERREHLLAAPVSMPMDLLQGLPALRPSARISVPMLKLAGALLLAIAGMYLFSQLLTWRQLAAQEAQLHEAIRQNFAVAHPGLPIVDPILQWRQLHGRQGGPASGDALDQVSNFALMSPREIRPQRIDADAKGMKITLGSSDAAQLKAALQSKGMPFETETTENGLEQIILTRKEGGRP